MPALPTLTVSQAVADRIMAAFGPGMAPAEAAARYKEWLRRNVNAYVEEAELVELRKEHQIAENKKRQEIAGVMPQEPDPTVP
jgi:hypothetical protein